MLGLNISTLIPRLFTLLTALTIHEFAHAWTADQMGDDTPRLHGRLTLNPLAHLDPLGSLMLILVGFGWAKPVPINPYALRRRSPSAVMLVSLAGPFSNLLLAVLGSIPFQIGLMAPNFAVGGGVIPNASSFLMEFIFLNLILAFFNLIPLAPLDGEKVAEFLLPPEGQDILRRLRPYGGMILLALLFIGPMLGFNLLNIIVGWPARQLLMFLVT
jgi:Zn-dependent protease